MIENVLYIIIGSIGVICVLLMFRNIWSRIREAPFLRFTPFLLIAFPCVFIVMGFLNLMGIDYTLVLTNLGVTIMGFYLFTTYLYYETLYTVKPALWRLAIGMGLTLTATLLFLFYSLQIYGGELIMFFSFSAGVYASAFGIYVFRSKLMKLYDYKGLKIEYSVLINLLITSSLTMVIDFLTSFKMIEQGSSEWLIIFVISGIFMLITIILMVLNNILYGSYTLILPIPIHSIFIFNREGNLVYNHGFKTRGPEKTEIYDDYVSQALMSFSAFFKEILGINAKLSFIDAESFNFLFAEFPEDSGTIVLVTSHSNYYLNKLLLRFGNELPAKLLKKNDEDSPNFKEEFDDLIKRIFPFLDF